MGVEVQGRGSSESGIGLASPGHSGNESKAQALIETIQEVVIWALRVFSLPIEVLLHTRFGVRYLTFPIFALSYLAMLLYWLGLVVSELFVDGFEELNGLIGGSQEGLTVMSQDNTVWPWVFRGYAVIGITRVGLTQLQNFRGITLHSRYSGSPLPFWFMIPGLSQEYTVKRFVEPLLAIVAGWCIWYFLWLDTIAWYVWLCAAGMAVRNHMEYMMLRGRVLDVLDAQISSEELHSAIFSNQQPRSSRGSAVAGIVRPTATVEERKRLADIFGSMARSVRSSTSEESPAVRGKDTGIRLGPDPSESDAD